MVPTMLVTINWTKTAIECLEDIPPKPRAGLIKKVGQLRDVDPRTFYKPLVGPLLGYRRVPYSRYRAIYKVDEDPGSDSKMVNLTVDVIAAGIRKEGSAHDVYKLAQRLVRLGIVGPGDLRS